MLPSHSLRSHRGKPWDPWHRGLSGIDSMSNSLRNDVITESFSYAVDIIQLGKQPCATIASMITLHTWMDVVLSAQCCHMWSRTNYNRSQNWSSRIRIIHLWEQLETFCFIVDSHENMKVLHALGSRKGKERRWRRRTNFVHSMLMWQIIDFSHTLMILIHSDEVHCNWASSVIPCIMHSVKRTAENVVCH